MRASNNLRALLHFASNYWRALVALPFARTHTDWKFDPPARGRRYRDLRSRG